MGLKPYDRKISQIFNNTQYDVDFYQREYKWNDLLEHKPVSSLLKDIFYRFDLEKYNPNANITPESTDKLEWYYLNSFMTHTTGGKKYIVDGQQRLTTITLISMALYHIAKQMNLPEHVLDTLKGSIQGTTEFGPSYWMGFKDRKDALHDVLTNNTAFSRKPTNSSESNIYANYELIYSELLAKFTTSHKLQTFISYFRNRVFLIEIEVDKNKDVAMVFEVINDRGIPLRPYEILKGKLLSVIEISDRGKYVDIWEKAIKQIEDYEESEIDEFFSCYFRGKYSDSTEQYRKLESNRYHKAIFLDEFDSKIGLKNNEKNCRSFIQDELPYFVDLYRETLNYYDSYTNNFEHVYFNQLNDIDGQFPLIMASITRNDPDKDKKISEVSRLFDRYFTSLRLTNSYRSNEFNTSVISLTPRIRNSSLSAIPSIIDAQLLLDVQDAHDVKDLKTAFQYDFFKGLGYNSFGSGFLRYFFARVDHYISDCSDIPEFGSYKQLVQQTRGGDVYHIEHILANNPASAALFSDETEFNEQRNRLGALILLKGKDNESSGNETYADKLKTLLPDMYHKKVGFKNFVMQSNLDFKPYLTFDKNSIEERQKLLYNLSKLIWQL
jgi:uncharacterized protein with ParB-like and HNH nuclease domain